MWRVTFLISQRHLLQEVGTQQLLFLHFRFIQESQYVLHITNIFTIIIISLAILQRCKMFENKTPCLIFMHMSVRFFLR